MNSFACTFSLFVGVVVVPVAPELVAPAVVAVAAVVPATVATPSVRTPGGQRWSSREEVIGQVVGE